MCKTDESQDECIDLEKQIQLLTAEEKIRVIEFIESSLLNQEKVRVFDVAL